MRGELKVKAANGPNFVGHRAIDLHNAAISKRFLQLVNAEQPTK
jgi:hypothetical protein